MSNMFLFFLFASVRSLIASSPHLKSRLEAAVKGNQESLNAKASSANAAARSATKSSPSITLKTNFLWNDSAPQVDVTDVLRSLSSVTNGTESERAAMLEGWHHFMSSSDMVACSCERMLERSLHVTESHELLIVWLLKLIYIFTLQF